MATVVGTIRIALLNDGKADVRTEGLEPLQVAQALATASAQIILAQRIKAGQAREDSMIVSPSMML